ncbi:hypothetical protein TIFTF001_028848 [Ficus carica]|uniref:R13L1/DRL21-like LRR repeat region domain-containing protein n=1 Tax=Ficus carica TaxID=3494 RepID=A0AA88IX54_FICCA|nr:hypothetical protein TIFTF001_028848 [Ficus carica]
MKLEDLGELNNLKGSLCIEGIADAKDVGEAERAQLKEKESLVALELQFLGCYNNTALL